MALLGSDELLGSYLGGEVDPTGEPADHAEAVLTHSNGHRSRRRRAAVGA